MIFGGVVDVWDWGADSCGDSGPDGSSGPGATVSKSSGAGAVLREEAGRWDSVVTDMSDADNEV